MQQLLIGWIAILLVWGALYGGGGERCLQCHQPMKGFSPFHEPARLGCSSCHLGNPQATQKTIAHQGMVVVPGNVADVDRTCGQVACHPNLSRRMHHNIMTTGRGIVAVNRWVFGETSDPDGSGHLSRLDTTGADLHLRQLCATCHLAFPKRRPAPISERSRGGGCVACHLSYSDAARKQLQTYLKTAALPTIHPRLTVQVKDVHCFGCHSRSGRISTNYQGWHETLLKAMPQPAHGRYRKLADHRIFEKHAADVHFERGLQCIDCHTWQETMGDGRQHIHEEQQQVVQCEDCHRTAPPRLAQAGDLSIIDWKLLTLRKISLQKWQPLVTRKGRQVLYNVGVVPGEDQVVLIAKNTGQRFYPRPPSEECTWNLPGHQQVSCQSCHTAWAPRCIACHVGFKPDVPGRDHLTGKTTRGRWVEYRAQFLAQFPTLGVVKREKGLTVEPFVPGMILTIDFHQQPDDTPMVNYDRFQRLYAPVSPHTIQRKGASCETCHLNPVALGYGEGSLTLQRTSGGQWQWQFRPTYSAHPADGLPLDAWIPFLSSQGGNATRQNAQALPLTMQQRMLRVGACLTCHPYRKTPSIFYNQFQQSLSQMTNQCRLPIFPD